jgi:peroxiredoxin family protein
MAVPPPPGKSKLVIVVSRGTLDGLYPPLILATTAASLNMEAHLYFTFGGMKLLTKETADTLVPSVDLGLSKEQMMGLLKKGGMPTVREMLAMAREAGVKIHGCSPTMELFGTKRQDLVAECDDVIGAATFLNMAADPGTIALFV